MLLDIERSKKGNQCNAALSPRSFACRSSAHSCIVRPTGGLYIFSPKFKVHVMTHFSLNEEAEVRSQYCSFRHYVCTNDEVCTGVASAA